MSKPDVRHYYPLRSRIAQPPQSKCPRCGGPADVGDWYSYLRVRCEKCGEFHVPTQRSTPAEKSHKISP